jgi:hypothetical protein
VGVEAYPYGLLRMIVSLEAIFLSRMQQGTGAWLMAEPSV